MEFFGISGSELLLIIVVGVIIVGPKHVAQGIYWLKSAIEKARQWSAQLREEASATKDGIKIDLSTFDPREYDPRKLIKDAVAEEMQAWIEATKAAPPADSTPKENETPPPQQTPESADTPAAAPSPDQAPPAEDEPEVPASLKLFEPQLRALEEKRSRPIEPE